MKKISFQTTCSNLALLILIFSYPGHISALSHGLDLYENIDNCPSGLTGPDCDIPYETCPDKRRRCFNNSKCVRNNKKDIYYKEYGYRCDCSSAAEVSSYAGHECEHSSEETCENHGRTSRSVAFCSNGGKCGSYIEKGERHAGCYCPMDYEGAHCQYLKATNIFPLERFGEASFPDVGDNFYGFKEKEITSEGPSAVAISLIVCAFSGIVLGVVLYLYKQKKKDAIMRKGMQRIESGSPPPPTLEGIQSAMDADGSGTMTSNKSWKALNISQADVDVI